MGKKFRRLSERKKIVGWFVGWKIKQKRQESYFRLSKDWVWAVWQKMRSQLSPLYAPNNRKETWPTQLYNSHSWVLNVAGYQEPFNPSITEVSRHLVRTRRKISKNSKASKTRSEQTQKKVTRRWRRPGRCSRTKEPGQKQDNQQ